MIFDHREKNFQYGKFKTKDIEVIETNENGDFVVQLNIEQTHLFRGSCCIRTDEWYGNTFIIIS